ncbi:phosphatidylglycerophosphatase A family protein [Plastoroseomonas arctica]|uniref:Phosphatidylglycerophosphatase A n=1 Tax=Plastoroseomonas arctica TaxID=1509237 RepID=A0AAF1K4R1_9PROT|nr:phosphatidylglycerophosphatase A [Plastoroseomonas arctica]MBR0656703.1 phosphatidylglycerophosphatase A [Plastoroseomonas arctica]
MTLARLVASLGGIGHLRPAPGTWGSAAVLPCVLLGPLPCLALAALACALGFWALHALSAEAASDPGWVVIDEAAGQLLALAVLPVPSLAGVIAAFALFRLFDITKPGPVGWADRQHGPLGVMLDDVIAGAMAAATLVIVQYLVPGVLS